MKKVVKKYKKKLLTPLVFLSLTLSSSAVIAENGENGEGFIVIPNPVRFESINEFLTELTNLLIQLGLALVTFMVVLGGAYIMFGGANPQNIEKGKNIIKWTVAGVMIVLFARAILALIYFVIGV